MRGVQRLLKTISFYHRVARLVGDDDGALPVLAQRPDRQSAGGGDAGDGQNGGLGRPGCFSGCRRMLFRFVAQPAFKRGL